MPRAKATAPPDPPYFIAAEPLFIAHPEGGMPARAHSPGDHVPAGALDRWGWRDKVTVPPEFRPETSEPAGKNQASTEE